MNNPPARSGGPPKTDPHRELYERVIDALHALPSRFRTSLRIEGIPAIDLFTLNTPLGAAIEQSVVDNLNDFRAIWDPDKEYELYNFVRQPQAFPDVRLQTTAPSKAGVEEVLMGIELKGWFVLAKEGEPSFRYKASPEVCRPHDLIVVYPWMLDEVVSGSPRLLQPFIEEARYAAEHRNHYWTVLRGNTGPDAGIRPATFQKPYPSKSDKYNDEAINDKGSNFGRIARGNLMGDFIAKLMELPLSGIPARHWQSFLHIFADGVKSAKIEAGLKRIHKQAKQAGANDESLEAIDQLGETIALLLKSSK